MHMTKLVGILNVTPDSFSDGGIYLEPVQAAWRIAALRDDGADIIDIGAESTRPGAEPLDTREEWMRLRPALHAAVEMHVPVISVDTRHALTVERAITMGAHWINDVGGFTDPDMLKVVKDADCKLVVMHSLGVPASPERTLPEQESAIEAVCAWARQAVERLMGEGIDRARIILDPGIGFGKNMMQSLEIVRRISELKTLGLPVMVGHSRKSFLSLFTDRPAAERDEETLILSEFLAVQRVDYLRVHEMKRHRHMLNIVARLL
jgi:dihydropteroate synthase